jgi:hypothetical protein
MKLSCLSSLSLHTIFQIQKQKQVSNYLTAKTHADGVANNMCCRATCQDALEGGDSCYGPSPVGDVSGGKIHLQMTLLPQENQGNFLLVGEVARKRHVSYCSPLSLTFPPSYCLPSYYPPAKYTALATAGGNEDEYVGNNAVLLNDVYVRNNAVLLNDGSATMNAKINYYLSLGHGWLRHIDRQ